VSVSIPTADRSCPPILRRRCVAERSAVAEALTETLADLPESLRVVVVLRYYADLSEREIAIAIVAAPAP